MRRSWSANTPSCRPPEAIPLNTPSATDPSGSAAPAYVLCGYISGVYGVRGWVKIFSYTRPIDNLLRYRPWQLRDDGNSDIYNLESSRRTQRGLIAKLHGVDDRDQAEALRGQKIWIDAAQFPTLPKGEYYHRQLLGLAAFDQQGETLGTVDQILETGAHDVLLIRGEQEYLIPYAPGETVLKIDLSQGRIDLRWDGVRE